MRVLVAELGSVAEVDVVQQVVEVLSFGPGQKGRPPAEPSLRNHCVCLATPGLAEVVVARSLLRVQGDEDAELLDVRENQTGPGVLEYTQADEVVEAAPVVVLEVGVG